MGIKHQMFSLGLLSIICTATVGGLSYWAVTQLQQTIEHNKISSFALRNHMQIDMMHDALRGDVLAILNATAKNKQADFASIENDLKEHSDIIKKSVEQNQKLDIDPMIKNNLQEMAAPLNAYMESAIQLFDAAHHHPTEVDQRYEKFVKEFRAMEEKLEMVSNLMEKTVLQSVNNSDQLIINIKRIILGVLVFSAALILLAYRQISRKIYQQIGGEPAYAVEIANCIAKGDLSMTIQIDDKSQASLLFAIKTMQQSLSDLVKSVQYEGQEVNNASHVISQLALSAVSGADSQNDAASSVAAAVEELSTSISHISEHANQAAHISNEAEALSIRGSETIATTGTEMSQLSAVVSQAAEVIQHLGEKSQQITTIVQVIREIADQTNLLALNAAIEAARAGEQGRGFAVVADEVRKLAERTSESTQQITGMIKAVQDGVKESITQMQGAEASVKRGVHLAYEAQSAVQTIKNGSVQVYQLIADISHALGEQNTASQDIARNIEHITSIIADSRESSASNNKAAENLERCATALLHSTHAFKI